MTDSFSPQTLKQIAREQLLGKYPIVILSYLIMQFITFFIMNFASSTPLSTGGVFVYYGIYFIVLLLNGIFIAGQHYLYLRIARNEECALGDMWYGFKNTPDKAIAIQFVLAVISIVCGIPFYLFLYRMLQSHHMSLLLPCILTGLFYFAVILYVDLLFSQTFYLLIDRPQAGVKDLFTESMRIMSGHKLQLFVVRLSFIGMYLLVILTFGLGIFWIYPYVSAANANFYQKLRLENNKDEP